MDLNLSSGRLLTLNEVLYVPEIWKNLISASLLVKHGFKLVFEADKFILMKNGIYVGIVYATNGMFKININNEYSPSAYLIVSFDTWHARLGHVNVNSIRSLIYLGLIPKCDHNKSDKCDI